MSLVASVASEPRARRIALPERGGEVAAYELGPEDRPIDVLFLHANSFNARAYRTILEPLSDLRILAIDLRGHGKTDLPLPTGSRTNWSETRDDVEAVMARLDLKDVVLAGHSMGGTLALLVAARLPERVRAVAAFDPVLMPQALIERAKAGEPLEGRLIEQGLRRRQRFASREAAYQAYHGRGAFKTWSDDMLRDYVADGFRDTPEGDVELACSPAWEVSNYGAQGNDTWEAFRASRCPIQVLLAQHDSPASRSGEELALIDRTRVRVDVVPDTTHFLPMERPDLVQQALRAAAR